MKRFYLMIMAVVTALSAASQTMNVVIGKVTYCFPAAQTQEMTYSDGSRLTIQGKEFVIDDITRIYVDETAVTDNQVTVTYEGTEAAVTVAGNVARYVTPSVAGAHVQIVQSDEFSTAGMDEITYTLAGNTTDGEFYLAGSFKTTIELNGLTLTNPSGAAIHVQNGKRIAISVKKGTVNTLTDCSGGAQKACLYVKGHTELKGKGTLTVYGNTGHGIKSGEYLSMKNCEVNVLSAVKDGIQCAEYFLMESGTLTVSGVGDDALQVEIDGDASTGITDDHEDEDSGNMYIEGGTITASVTAAAAKALKADGDVFISGGTITASTSGGGVWDSDEQNTKASACLSSDGAIEISDGTLLLTSTGAGGKGISGDSTLKVLGGTITISTSGGIVAYRNGTLYNGYTGNTDWLDSNYKSSPKGIKIDGAITISGGDINVTAQKHEGIESKSTLTIDGGQVYSYSSDDAINSSSHLTISDGYVCAYSSGNDGLDANGNCYIQGGLVYAIGKSAPEVAIDANTEQGYKLYVTGGTIVAIGGLERGSSLTQSCYSTNSWSKNVWYALYNDGEVVFAFKTPSSGGTPLVVSTASTPTLKKNVTVAEGTDYFNGLGNIGGTVTGGTDVSLSTYTGEGGHGPGPGPGW